MARFLRFGFVAESVASEIDTTQGFGVTADTARVIAGLPHHAQLQRHYAALPSVPLLFPVFR
ncbi:hypothetical protein [Novosphingobium colocasiae]|uniref:hypothetical protein n=1 Tax=Novosphingobium colocasiae TaxID=1256513 RepID=UPI0035AEC186